LILDASQAIGHRKIDLKKTPADALCAPGHKALFGIMGSGFAVFSDNTRRQSFIEGGSGRDSLSPFMPKMLPEGYEAGTLPTPAIISLHEGIKYVREYGEENIKRRLGDLTDRLYDRLNSISGIKILGYGSGIISFTHERMIPDEIVYELNKRRIAVRGGLHCSPSAHRTLGTLKGGAVRASLSVFNKPKELDDFYRAMKDILLLG